MTTDFVLHFIFKHNIVIIEVLFGISIIAILYLSILAFRQDENSSDSPNWKQLEDSLKKIIEGAPIGKGKIEGNSSSSTFKIPEGASESVVVQELQNQLKELQEQVTQKDQELNQIKEATTSQAATGANSTEMAQYEEKIKDLESRLNEYSIIEDDIADLSFYKEETVRLQNEIEKLKSQIEILESSSKNVNSSIPVSSSSASISAETINSDSVLVSSSVEEIKPKEEATDSGFIDNDIMAEFERAVAEQKGATSAPAKVTQSTSKNIEPIEIAKEEINVETNSENELNAIGEMNLDKMLNEAQTLNEVAPNINEDSNGGSVLEVGMDTDKLLAEASSMDNTNEDTQKKIGA